MTEPHNTQDMLGRSGLVSVDKARAMLLSAFKGTKTTTVSVPLEEAFDRVLAEPIISTVDLPSQARSTMDGYAVRAADTFGASESMPCYLNITGEVIMGKAPAGEVKKGSCQKIPTGGLLPKGADSVVMFEHTVPVDDTLIEIVKDVGSGTNLIQTGDDIGKGVTALPAGHLLRPQDIGLLAGIGVTEVVVRKKVRVAIFSTGDEIISHRETPLPGQIRNINTLALAGLVRQAGGVYVDYGIVSDREDIFLPAMKKAVKENDIVIFSGGSSVGLRDLGTDIVEKLGPPGLLVHGVTLRPGKPVLIGMSGTTAIFGLPGHPVSAMVCFDFFVKPSIHFLDGRLSQAALPAPFVPARLSRNVNSAPGRRDVVRVLLEKSDDTWSAVPVLGKSSSISTLSRAHGYFIIDEDSQGAEENSMIEVFIF